MKLTVVISPKHNNSKNLKERNPNRSFFYGIKSVEMLIMQAIAF